MAQMFHELAKIECVWTLLFRSIYNDISNEKFYFFAYPHARTHNHTTFDRVRFYSDKSFSFFPFHFVLLKTIVNINSINVHHWFSVATRISLVLISFYHSSVAMLYHSYESTVWNISYAKVFHQINVSNVETEKWHTRACKRILLFNVCIDKVK